MRIVVASNDKMRVARRFGRSRYFVLFTIEQGCVVNREIIENPWEAHSRDGDDDERARRLPAALGDIVVAGAMGQRAYDWIAEGGMIPILTDIEEVDEVPVAYARGSLADHPERIQDGCFLRRAG